MADPTVQSSGSRTVSRVLKGQLCTGCGLCVGVADGTMVTEAPGYSRPAITGPVTSKIEAAIAESCPGAKVAPWQDAPHRHISWGPWHQCLTGYATDPLVRHRASSGGGLSALLIHALATKQIDRVLHVEADPERPTRNRMRWSSTPAEIIEGAGSRYAASSPLVAIDAILDEPGRFAFVGKPCDVSALRQLATVDPRVNERVPLMLSFFCAGIPSHAGADRIVRSLGLEPDDVVQFRYRGNGWPGLTRVETRNGTVREMRYADSWGGELSKEVQFRCKLCPDAVGGVADVACADAWYGGETGYPQFEEQDGRSLILTRTVAGEALLKGAVDSGALDVDPLPIGEIDLMQPGQARRKRLVAGRLLACTVTGSPRPEVAGLDVGRAARTASLAENLKNCLGTIRRIVQKRR